MTAKAAIERAQNELARFLERELARQDVNIHSIILFIINPLNYIRLVSRSTEPKQVWLCTRKDYQHFEIIEQ